MKIKSKKAMMLYYIMIPGFIAGIIVFWIYSLDFRPSMDQRFIGDNQLKMVSVSQQAEERLIFADQLSRMAIDMSAYSLAEKGGFLLASACGDYDGYPIWVSGDKECYPDYENGFKYYTEKNIKKGIDANRYIFPDDMNYNVEIIGNSVAGIADKDMLLNVKFEPKKDGFSYSIDGEQGEAGYLVEPSFIIEMNYDIKEYDDLISTVKNIADSCSETEDKKVCVEERIPDGWILGTCEGEPSPNNHFVFCVKSEYHSLYSKEQPEKITYKFALNFE